MKRQNFSRQSGFTLVEIAIVLVIIGLLLGGVLKGQEMIENAKIKNVINDLKGVSAAYYSYQDRYKAIPGDDALAATRFTGADNGSGNGIISGLYADTAAPTAATESNSFWQHTRMAGFLSGTATAAAALPGTHAAGGVLGVQSTAFGMNGNVVCAGSVPWKMAIAIDTQLDDGNGATGSVRGGISAIGAPNAATTPGATAANAAYGSANATTGLESGELTVCMKI